ncbi:MAG: Jag N-terminal domain-containing protein [Actinomycetota bacterium]|jgi:spoIIIJ-associated protein|nr:Jag N-terminal domain-containing protein [Actinomycetota bacterium]MDA3015008.1 Jag N-terminal domain-containing protein [Actinomycetota bacterium]MDA3028837.1 Jag N-terminal domain-containing protein [Actinomycetota bacterium]
MEWVTMTGKTVEEATEMALEQLGVASDEADVEVLEEPRSGLFGRTRGEARIRARVRPAEVRPKRDNRRRRSNDGGPQRNGDGKQQNRRESASSSSRQRQNQSKTGSEQKGSRKMDDNENRGEPVDPALVGEAAVAFMDGLAKAFGSEATVELDQDGTELEVRVRGSDLGLMVGPGGRTLTAVQDLARVAAQRRLGDHETHLRVDVAGYRERRKASLEAFARKIAGQVRESGKALAIEPMASPDRKVIHDVLSSEEGVSTRSEGEDPNRRVIVSPA